MVTKALDPAWLEVQYNNRARIPDHPAIFERWREASAFTRSRQPCLLDVAYGEGHAETMDVFPAVSPGAPVIVFIHGGYWRSLDKADHSFVAPALVAAGAMVVVPNYGLCPSVSIEDIALQMTRVIAWVRRHAHEHGGDASNITVVGHSAGGQLAAMLLCCRWDLVGADLPAQPLRGALSISGVHDLSPLRFTPSLQADLRLTPRSVNRLSPAFFPAPARPLLAVAGGLESDEFLRQNRLIRDAWGEPTVPVCETVDGANHLTVLNRLADPSHRLHHLALGLAGLGPLATRFEG